jgi:hypothetical protein
LLKKVGQGTFGAYVKRAFLRKPSFSHSSARTSVYKAFDTKNNRLVAMKILEPKGDAEKRVCGRA